VGDQRNRDLAEQIARMERQQAALLRLASRGLAVDGDTDAALREITELASATFEVDRASVWFLSEDRQELRLAELHERSAGRHSRGLVLRAEDHPRYFAALESGRAIDAHDVLTDERTAEFKVSYSEPLGITSLLDASIRDGGQVVGVVCVEHTGPPRIWAGDEIAFCGALADQVALTMLSAERMRLQREQDSMRLELIHTQRLESIGTLAAGVAHEISNPLGYIAANLDYVAARLDRLDEPAVVREIRRATMEAQLGADRVRRIVSDLKRFARRDASEPVPVDVRAVLDTAISMSWNEIRHRARLVRDFGPPVLVVADEDRLVQVFLNFLLNAAHAIEDGSAEKNEIRVATRIRGDRLSVEVQDSGAGIPAEALGSVFDPFFTTKPAELGTGLGLSICQSIITSIGGSIEVESQEGVGTTFRVLLPVHPQEGEVREVVRRTVEITRRARILLVDDEKFFINAMSRLLGGEHEVHGVTTAREALALLDSGEEFDLVLCDLMMSEMSGIEFHAELASRDPKAATRIVFMTGGAFTPRARSFLQGTSNRCVEKPLDLETIDELIGEQLGALDDTRAAEHQQRGA
jgi:C4-dicarboxylate-specific signal transduction histidine kinase/ActR/RegA family two-component response regulator